MSFQTRASKSSIRPSPLALPAPGIIVVRDAIARADSAIAAGSADIGGAWRQDAGLVAIAGHAFYTPDGTADNIISISSERPANRISCDMLSADYEDGAPKLMIRYIDASNYLYVRAIESTNKLQLRKVVATVDSLIANSSVPPLPTFGIINSSLLSLVVVWNRAAFELDVNHQLVLTQTLSTPDHDLFQNAARIALSPNTVGSISNIEVWA